MMAVSPRCHRCDCILEPGENAVSPALTWDRTVICTICAEMLYTPCGRCGRLYRADVEDAHSDLCPDCSSDMDNESPAPTLNH